MPVLKPFTTGWDLNPCAGTQTQPKSSLALEPTWLGLEPGLNLPWDFNLCGWDSNLTKTLLGTWTHMARTWSQPKPIVLQLRSHTSFQNPMELRFLKNSVRDKVIGKRWVYLERHALHTQSVGHRRRQEQPWEKHTPKTSVGHYTGWVQPPNVVQLVFVGWVSS